MDFVRKLKELKKYLRSDENKIEEICIYKAGTSMM
jgi:hypothetical protein